MGVLAAIVKNMNTLIGPVATLIYPLYATMRAIESASSLDDQQWLTYWVLYSFITLFELFCWKVLAWIPIWPYLKLVFCMWLVLPKFSGAAYIYENIVRKYVKPGDYINWSLAESSSKHPEEQKKVIQMMSLDGRKSVERFIDHHGPEAFERVVKAAEREAGKH